MARDHSTLASMPESRRDILTRLKRAGTLGIADLADAVGMTYEAVRQRLSQLERDGWVTRRLDRGVRSPGRPPSVYCLTTAGDHLFPKAYDELAINLIDAANERLGPQATRTLLEEVVRTKVEEWAPRLEGLSLAERLEALRGIYLAEDPYTRIEDDEERGLRLIETNCPYLEVARHRPALCSVTVSVLRRLLGREVVRSERFQDGDNRCVFKVLTDRRLDGGEPLFDTEPAADPPSETSDGEPEPERSPRERAPR